MYHKYHWSQVLYVQITFCFVIHKAVIHSVLAYVLCEMYCFFCRTAVIFTQLRNVCYS
jgi:hypothetical protein